MSYREQLGQMSREYRREAEKLDQKIEELGSRTEVALLTVSDRLSGAMLAIDQQLSAFKTVVHDQLSAVVQAVDAQRAEHQELARTLQGRTRLTEERLGKMLDLVESSLDEELTGIRESAWRLWSAAPPESNQSRMPLMCSSMSLAPGRSITSTAPCETTR
jgi:hypothetical protein